MCHHGNHQSGVHNLFDKCVDFNSLDATNDPLAKTKSQITLKVNQNVHTITSVVFKCSPSNCILLTARLSQVSSSVLSSSGEGTGPSSAVKYPGQDGLYSSVGLSQAADVASVRGEPWCPMALA